MSRARPPRPIADSIAPLRARAEPATALAAIQGAWRPAVGERIAREAWPLREREGEVTVACRTATWAQELDLLQVELRQRLNESLTRGRVGTLRFVVAADPFQEH